MLERSRSKGQARRVDVKPETSGREGADEKRGLNFEGESREEESVEASKCMAKAVSASFNKKREPACYSIVNEVEENNEDGERVTDDNGSQNNRDDKINAEKRGGKYDRTREREDGAELENEREVEKNGTTGMTGDVRNKEKRSGAQNKKSIGQGTSLRLRGNEKSNGKGGILMERGIFRRGG
eukprot:5095171-Pleurochrysis_carterae.AAC.1